MIKISTLVVMVCSFSFAQQDYSEWVQRMNIPLVVVQTFRNGGYDSTYDFSFHINPFYLRGDFNGDGISDYAVLIKQRKNSKIGIVFIHGKMNQVFIVGAGHVIGRSIDDLRSINAWHVYTKGPTHQGVTDLPPPNLKGDALLVEKLESSSGLIYWTGLKYKWYQQGD